VTSTDKVAGAFKVALHSEIVANNLTHSLSEALARHDVP
jgi:hypothetical protein